MPFRGRPQRPPIEFALILQGRSARAGAPRGWPRRGSAPVRFKILSRFIALPKRTKRIFASLNIVLYLKGIQSRELSFLMAVSVSSRQLGLDTTGAAFKVCNFYEHVIAKILFVCPQVH